MSGPSANGTDPNIMHTSEIASSSGRTTLVNTEHAAATANGVVGDGPPVSSGSASARLSNLDMAKVTSPTVERSNPLSMRVTARHSGAAASGSGSRPALKRKAGTSSSKDGLSLALQQPSSSSLSKSGSGSIKGKGPGTNSGDSDEDAMEPKDAIRQQFYVRFQSEDSPSDRPC